MSVEDELGIPDGPPLPRAIAQSQRRSLFTLLSVLAPFVGAAGWLLMGPCGVFAKGQYTANTPGAAALVFAIGWAGATPIGLILGIVALIKAESKRWIAGIAVAVYSLFVVAALFFFFARP